MKQAETNPLGDNCDAPFIDNKSIEQKIDSVLDWLTSPTDEDDIRQAIKELLELKQLLNNPNNKRGETLYLYDSIEDRTMEEFSSIEEVEKFVRDCYVVDGDVHPDIESLNIYKKVGGVYVEETGGTIIRRDDIVPIVKVIVVLNSDKSVPVSDTTKV